MKRRGNLWGELVSYSNLYRAVQKAARGKRNKANVAAFLQSEEAQICRLQDELIAKTYRPSPYYTFEIYEPKKRLISAAPFRDRVVHHAVVGVLEPIFEPGFIFDSYACRKGKGTHRAVRRYQEFARYNTSVLKCDIRKFYPSIDRAILKGQIRHKIKDPDLLRLIDLLIDHGGESESTAYYFPGDDLFSPLERRCGLPLGNQTSQFFSNVYLTPFDRWVKQDLQVRCYIRYADDFAIFGNSRAELRRIRTACREKLAELHLLLPNGKSILHNVKNGVRFLGYRIAGNTRTLPTAYVGRLRRRLNAMHEAYINGKVDEKSVCRRLSSLLGHVGHAGGSGLFSTMFSDIFGRGIAERF